MLRKIQLLPLNWEHVIMAIDFSTLQHLDVRYSNMDQEQIKVLVDRIPDDTIFKVPLETLDIRDTDIVRTTEWRPILTELRRKAPLVTVLDK